MSYTKGTNLLLEKTDLSPPSSKQKPMSAEYQCNTITNHVNTRIERNILSLSLKSRSKQKASSRRFNYQNSSKPFARGVKNKQSWKKNITGCDTNALIDDLTSLAKNKHSNDIERITSALESIDIDSKQLHNMFNILVAINHATLSSEEIETKSILKSMWSDNFLKNFQLFMLGCAQGSLTINNVEDMFQTSVKIHLHLSNMTINLLPGEMLPLLKRSLVFIYNLIGRMDKRLKIEEYSIKTRYMIEMIAEKITQYEIQKEEVSETEIAEVKAMSVLPTQRDICGKAPKLKKNIIEGSYKTADHYLTVQFKLLHEDFVAPLREGIRDYIRGCESRHSGIAIYKHVKILGPSIESGKFCHVVQLESKVNWKFVSRFFIYGSLVLFTTNGFDSFFLGSIIAVNNDEKTIGVKLNKMHNIVCKDIYSEKFTLAASKVFFEPYFHVLSALKNMNSDELPMEKYIVQANKDIEPPIYLEQLGISSYTIYNEDVSIMELGKWPELSSIKLNPSQLKAVKAAITNEFVVIQGPPGTGKTFIAHQIVKILLDNLKSLTPILVVCYKNHALDQFLEGILEKTENIIRIGGRSNSEQLEQLNIKHKRRYHSYGYVRYEQVLKEMAKAYFKANYHLTGLKKHGIISVKNLLPYITLPKFKAEIAHIDYEEWLMEGAHVDGEINVLDEIDKEMFISESDQNEYYSTCSEEINVNHKIVQSEESTRRFEQNYCDDYVDSYIFNDALKEVSQENYHDAKSRTQNTRFHNESTPEFITTIRNYKEQCLEYERMISEISDTSHSPDEENMLEKNKDEFIFQYKKNINFLQAKILFLKIMLSKKFTTTKNEIAKYYKLGQLNLWSLTTNQRWELYHSWVNDLANDIKRQMIHLEEAIREEEESLDKARNRVDLQILQKSDVIGITTTAAAKLRPMLNELGIKIVELPSPVQLEDQGDSLESLPEEEPSNIPVFRDKNVVTLETCSQVYFAGYLAHYFHKKNPCKDCLEKLINPDSQLKSRKELLLLNKSFYNFKIDSCSGLFSPSENLLYVVDTALKVYTMKFKEFVHKENVVSNLLNVTEKCVQFDSLTCAKCSDKGKLILKTLFRVLIHKQCKWQSTSIKHSSLDKLKVLKNV